MFTMQIPPESDLMPTVADPGFCDWFRQQSTKALDTALEKWRQNQAPEQFTKALPPAPPPSGFLNVGGVLVSPLWLLAGAGLLFFAWTRSKK